MQSTHVCLCTMLDQSECNEGTRATARGLMTRIGDNGNYNQEDEKSGFSADPAKEKDYIEDAESDSTDAESTSCEGDSQTDSGDTASDSDVGHADDKHSDCRSISGEELSSAIPSKIDETVARATHFLDFDAVEAVSVILESIKENPQPMADDASDAFRSSTTPPISISKYTRRLHEHMNCSDACLVVAFAYMNRFQRRNPSYQLNRFNLHRFLLTCLVVAVKYVDDIRFSNDRYARIGGICCQHLNKQEFALVEGMDWELHVTVEEFNGYCGHFREVIPLNTQQLKR